MATMPNPERKGYFGPHRDMPAQEGSRRVTGGRNRGVRTEAPPAAVEGASEDSFPAFNPYSDILIGEFVALTMELQEVQEGVHFYIRKVLEFGQGRRSLKMKILWYWLAMRPGQEEEVGSNRVRYSNCMEATWEPSEETFTWIDKEATIYSWQHVPRRGRSGHIVGSNVTVYGVQN